MSRRTSSRNLLTNTHSLWVTWLLLLLMGLGTAQAWSGQKSENPAAPPESAKSAQQQKSADEDVGQKISPKEAQELFHEVDDILKFASTDTDLPIKHEVKRKLSTRDEVVAYLQKSMADDKDAQRLRRSELVLKKFGLLPADFNLQEFLVTLLREQVAGYYDPQDQDREPAGLDWSGAATAGDGARTHARAAGPVVRAGKMDESAATWIWTRKKILHRRTSRTTK